MASPASRSAHSRSSARAERPPRRRVVSVEHEAHAVPQDHGHDQRLRGPAPAEEGQQPLVRGRRGERAPSTTPAARPRRRRPRARPAAAARCGRGRRLRAARRGRPARRPAPRRRGAAGGGRGRPPRRPAAAARGSPRRGARGRAAPRRWRAASRAVTRPGRSRPCASSPRGGSGRWPLPPRPRAPRRPPRCRRPRPPARPRSGSSRSATGTAPAPRAPSAAGAPPASWASLIAPASTRRSPSLRPSAETCWRSSASASASGVTSPRQTRMLPNVSRIELEAA